MSFDTANPTGCHDPLSPPVSVTPNFIPSDSLTHHPFLSSRLSLSLVLSVCLYVSLLVSGSIFTHASLDVHLEQLLSRLLQPQIDRDRAVWARLAFCCFLPPPPSNVSVWTAASRRMGLVHERVFKCVCMCAWIRPLQENYHFRFHSITASKHIQAFITHFIRLMFTDPDNVKPKGPSLERNSEKFSLSF